MTDEEYIRKAVELADGFEAMDECIDILEVDGTLWASAEWEGTEQCVLDALAAQLVRQVDALERWIVDAEHDYTDILDDFNRGRLKAQALGNDRTMNTLKCIVDSGVLECDSEPSS